MLLLYVYVLIQASVDVIGGGPPNCENMIGNCACETDQGLIDLSPLDSKDVNNPT